MTHTINMGNYGDDDHDGNNKHIDNNDDDHHINNLNDNNKNDNNIKGMGQQVSHILPDHPIPC